ncbi:MAG: hypothetical protein MK209_09330 [Planctomycetes bacterium]|nr:hypothetical protein [Planctomycetota bacterium]
MGGSLVFAGTSAAVGFLAFLRSRVCDELNGSCFLAVSQARAFAGFDFQGNDLGACPTFADCSLIRTAGCLASATGMAFGEFLVEANWNGIRFLRGMALFLGGEGHLVATFLALGFLCDDGRLLRWARRRFLRERR